MSDLRKNLDDLRREYRSANYPGDLADQILPPLSSHRRHGWKIAATLAAAAAIAFAIFLSRIAPMNEVVQIDPVVEVEEEIVQYTFADLPVLSASDLTTELDFAPTAPDFSFAAPSFSLSMEPEPETSTTQESA